MINVSEILKKIMKEYSLNQTQLSRAIDCDYSNVSRWCNNIRKPDIDTLEHILETFGYELEVTLKEKKDFNKSKDFYKEKTYAEIEKMTIDELVDYIFVTQDEDTIAYMCHVCPKALEYIPLVKQREFIKEVLENKNRLETYFKMIGEYRGIEMEMSIFLNNARHHLENESNIDKNILSKAEYLCFETSIQDAGYHDMYYSLYDFKLLDKDRKFIGIEIQKYYFNISKQRILEAYAENK